MIEFNCTYTTLYLYPQTNGIAERLFLYLIGLNYKIAKIIIGMNTYV